jgi:hypothetical protein
MEIKTTKKSLKCYEEKTSNLILLDSVFKLHLDKEINTVKAIDFVKLKGKKKKAFVNDMNKIKGLITDGYTSTMEFISFSLEVVK